ncbi:hypothetical protein [Flavobacterium rhizosphaerae]|uniref:Lipid/polyisoprenoid-binding YceI-like domain-containing protein n=1 Tax=Flavobacterium rhizosphaerae TaxID=3163298 RepID=A0ABW8Z1I1_9FLAO
MKMRRLFSFFIAVLGIGSIYAQTVQEHDTIMLQEVVLNKETGSTKLKTLSLKGPCYHPDNLNAAQEIITLVSGLPEGYLENITFTFNRNNNPAKAGSTFKDTKLELVFFEVDEDNQPGQEIYAETKIIPLKEDFIGQLAIDVSTLNIKVEKNIFVGVKRLEASTEKSGVSVDCLCSGQDKYFTFIRADEASPWSRRWECAAIRVDVTVAVQR